MSNLNNTLLTLKITNILNIKYCYYFCSHSFTIIRFLVVICYLRDGFVLIGYWRFLESSFSESLLKLLCKLLLVENLLTFILSRVLFVATDSILSTSFLLWTPFDTVLLLSFLTKTFIWLLKVVITKFISFSA